MNIFTYVKNLLYETLRGNIARGATHQEAPISEDGYYAMRYNPNKRKPYPCYSKLVKADRSYTIKPKNLLGVRNEDVTMPITGRQQSKAKHGRGKLRRQGVVNG